MRHGEADLPSLYSQDWDRALTEKGHSDSRWIGSALWERKWRPSLIYASSAFRVQQTLQNVSEGFLQPATVLWHHEYYQCNASQLADSLTGTASEHTCLLLIGHNPTLSDFVTLLCRQPVHLSPAQAILLSHDKTNWDEAIYMHNWTYEGSLLPKPSDN